MAEFFEIGYEMANLATLLLPLFSTKELVDF